MEIELTLLHRIILIGGGLIALLILLWPNKWSDTPVTPKKHKNLYDGCSNLGTGGGDYD